MAKMEFNYTFKNLSNVEKMQTYLLHTKPVLNTGALFSDGTKNYRTPAEPTAEDDVKVRLRTAKENANKVFLVYINQENETRLLTKKLYSDSFFDYYEGVIPKSENPTEYYFEIVSGKATCVYNRRGVMKEAAPFYNYKISPGFATPQWAKGAIFYQIFVDRFCNGDPTNDVLDGEYYYIGGSSQKVDDWNKPPATMGVREFYGGDLAGIMSKLDYLQDLGVEVLYLNPIFVSPSNHKYDIQDYDYIDPHYGVIVKDEGEVLPHWATTNECATKYISRVTDKVNLEASNEFFAQFVEELHRRGMRIILDGVFNHCGSFNKWLDREKIYENESGYEKGAFIEEDSPYNTFFKFYDKDTWPYNTSYDGWWGHDTLPKLNYEESPKLYEYILDIAKKWVSPPYNVDGWRLDVAADLGHSSEYNHKFWKDFRAAVKSVNKDALILAEHYGDPASWLSGDQWDTVMNYDAFMEPISWFLTGVEKHSDEVRPDLKNNYDCFLGAMTHHMSRFHTQSLEVAMNELSNHDHSRFLTRTNGNVGRTQTVGSQAADIGVDKGIYKEGVVIQMTWPGAPTIYYGDEVGVCGWTDPDNRRTYPWGNEDIDLLQFHKDIIRIRKDYQVFKTGSLKFLYGTQGVISYGRFTGNEKIVVAINNNEEPIDIRIPVWEIGVTDEYWMKNLMETSKEGHSLNEHGYKVISGHLTITMPKVSSMVLLAVYKSE